MHQAQDENHPPVRTRFIDAQEREEGAMCMSINKQQVNNTADSTVGTQAHDLAYRTHPEL